jgi:hypothetical protein
MNYRVETLFVLVYFGICLAYVLGALTTFRITYNHFDSLLNELGYERRDTDD